MSPMNPSAPEMPSSATDDFGPGPNPMMTLPTFDEDATDLASPEMVIDSEYEELEGFLKKRWEECRRGRMNAGIEQEWERALLNYKGEYAPDVLNSMDPNMSRVFVKLTRAVVASAKALIMQVLGNDAGYLWDLKPTADPDLSGINQDALQDIVEQATLGMSPRDKQAFLTAHDFQSVIDAKRTAAEITVDNMRVEIEDQLQEMRWDEVFHRAIDPLTIYGTAVFQGPLTVKRKPRKWLKDKSGKWKRALSRHAEAVANGGEGTPDDLRPEFRLIDVWKCYPDPMATRKEDMKDIFFRHPMNAHQVRQLRYEPNFKQDVIDEILVQRDMRGDWHPDPWENIVEPQLARNHSRELFVVYEYWGFMSGLDLQRYRVEIPDNMQNEDCLVHCWSLMGRVIKCVVSNMEPPEIPVHFVPYETVDTRIWGRGVPAQMEDSQAIYNAAERAKIDNMAISSGFQMTINLSKLSDRTDPSKIYPRKQWFVKDMDDINQPPIIFFQPKSNVPDMNALQESVRLHMQKETNLPDSASGLPGSPAHNRTAEGLSMQQGAAMSFIRSVIGNIDIYLTEPMIRSMYDWNMAFNPKEEIKGDIEIVATGVQGAMSREVLSQRLLSAMQTLGVDLKYYLRAEKGTKLFLQSMGFDAEGLVNTDRQAASLKQADLAMQAEADQAPKRIQPVMPNLNASLQLLQNTPPTTPVYPATYLGAARELGWLEDPEIGPKIIAAVNAMEQAAANQMKPLVSPQDEQILAEDIPLQLSPQEAAQHLGMPFPEQGSPQMPATPPPSIPQPPNGGGQ